MVAYSPQENLLVVLEVKWHLGVDGTYEEIAIEQAALGKHDRLKSLRHSVEAGAVTVSWPDTWPPVPDDTEWRWFVLTNDVLPTQDNNDSNIRIRSHQMLKHLLPAGVPLRHLVDLLDAPPTPDCVPNWERHRFGRLVVEGRKRRLVGTPVATVYSPRTRTHIRTQPFNHPKVVQVSGTVANYPTPEATQKARGPLVTLMRWDTTAKGRKLGWLVRSFLVRATLFGVVGTQRWLLDGPLLGGSRRCGLRCGADPSGRVGLGSVGRGERASFP